MWDSVYILQKKFRIFFQKSGEPDTPKNGPEYFSKKLVGSKFSELKKKWI